MLREFFFSFVPFFPTTHSLFFLKPICQIPEVIPRRKPCLEGNPSLSKSSLCANSYACPKLVAHFPGHLPPSERGWLCLQNSPVRRESRECEDRHPHRGELYKGDQFAANPAKQPSVGQVPAGIHGRTRYQEEQISQGQTGDEQVGHAAHGLHCTEDLDQGDVADEAYQNDDPIDGRDDIEDPWVEPVVVRGESCTAIGDVAVQEVVHFQVQKQTIIQSHPLGSFPPEKCSYVLLLNFDFVVGWRWG